MLAFLVSSASKRDAVGRRPKRKVFATEGLTVWDTEAVREISCMCFIVYRRESLPRACPQFVHGLMPVMWRRLRNVWLGSKPISFRNLQRYLVIPQCSDRNNNAHTSSQVSIMRSEFDIAEQARPPQYVKPKTLLTKYPNRTSTTSSRTRARTTYSLSSLRVSHYTTPI